jgi:hypothetical protein
MSSEAAKRATAKYQRDKMESISIRVKRDEGLYNRIKQAATVQGVKPAQFIKQALLNALDNSRPAQAPQPQPDTTPATPPDDVIQVPLSPDMIHNMDGAIRCGYSSDRVQYAIRAINTQIQQDIAAEKEKRRSCVQPAMSYTYDPYYDDAPPDDY